MSVIVPAILTPSREGLEAQLARVEGLVDSVQIDVVDGKFAGPPTWPYGAPSEDIQEIAEEHGLFSLGHFRFEMDLMVETPEQTVGAWIEAGASRIIVHVESTEYLPKLIDDLARNYGHDKGFAPDLLSFGLAVGVETDLALVEQYLEKIDYVQFMGIAKVGRQGQPFDTRVVPKIQEFHKKHPDVSIQVDGGVTLETAPELLSAGANRLVVGHDLWEETDIAAELERYRKLVETYGTYN